MARIKYMSPCEIQIALKKAGISQAGIARDLEISNTMVSRVVAGTDVSHRVRLHIAECIKRPVEDIWPVKENPTKTGRAMSSGLYDPDTAA